MQRKSIFTILGVMLAVVVTSLTLVFTVGPIVSADDESENEIPIYTLDKWDDFVIDENYVIRGISDSFYEQWIEQYDGSYTKYGLLFNAGAYPFEIKIVIPEDVREIAPNGIFYAIRMYITSLQLPSTLTTIGEYGLVEVGSECGIIIPNNVTSVGYNAFNYGSDVYCECSEEYANEHWNSNWKGDGSNVVIWNCNRTITFDTVGGNTIAEQKVCVDHYAVAPTNPIRDGFAFQYWYASDENTPFDFENEQVTDNMTLTAKWEAVATQNNENQNQENNQNQNNETTNNEIVSAEKKNNPLMAWIGGGIAAGLGVICGAAIVVAKKRRK